jgi:hypothetical protein
VIEDPGRGGGGTTTTAGDVGTVAEAVADEAAKTRDTANQMAGREPADVGTDVRVLAGMVQQLADQVERLALSLRGGSR